VFLRLKGDGDEDADEECDIKLNSSLFFFSIFSMVELKLKKPTINKNIFFIFNKTNALNCTKLGVERSESRTSTSTNILNAVMENLLKKMCDGMHPNGGGANWWSTSDSSSQGTI